jgi:hypothetical protein
MHVKPVFQRGMRQHSPLFFFISDAGHFHKAVVVSFVFILYYLS